jgi:hypothetical protein
MRNSQSCGRRAGKVEAQIKAARIEVAARPDRRDEAGVRSLQLYGWDTVTFDTWSSAGRLLSFGVPPMPPVCVWIRRNMGVEGMM